MEYCISIHALLAESDIVFCAIVRMDSIFLSTLSLRRATYLAESESEPQNISIHALLAESDLHVPAVVSPLHDISIHALLAESDPAVMVARTYI